MGAYVILAILFFLFLLLITCDSPFSTKIRVLIIVIAESFYMFILNGIYEYTTGGWFKLLAFTACWGFLSFVFVMFIDEQIEEKNKAKSKQNNDDVPFSERMEALSKELEQLREKRQNLTSPPKTAKTSNTSTTSRTYASSTSATTSAPVLRNTASSSTGKVPEKQVLPDENTVRIEELKKIIDAHCKGLREFESLIRSRIFEHFQKTTGDNEDFCEWLENTLDSVKNFTDELLNANLELVSRSNGRYDESAKVIAWGERYNTLNNWIKHGNGKGSLKERLEIPLHLMLDVQNPGKLLEERWESLKRKDELGKDYFEALDESLSDANDLDWMDVLSSLKMLVALWWLAIHPATTATQMAKAWLLHLRVCKYLHPEVIIAVEYWAKQRISTPNELEGFFTLLSNECSDSMLIDTLKESETVNGEKYFKRPDMFYVKGCGELWLGNELSAGLWFEVWESNRDKQEK